jgi:hypothetical protein
MIKQMKKYLLVLSAAAVLLLFPLIATAAAKVPGNMPEVKPLQPLPPGIKANVSRNIQNSAAQDENAPAADVGNSNQAAGQDNAEAVQQAPAGAPAAQPNAAAKPGVRWLVIIAVPLAIIALAYFRLRRPKNPPKNY